MQSFSLLAYLKRSRTYWNDYAIHNIDNFARGVLHERIRSDVSGFPESSELGYEYQRADTWVCPYTEYSMTTGG